MLDARRRAAVVGFLVAALALAGPFWFVDAGEVTAELAAADLGLIALVGVAALTWLGAWAFALRLVLGAIGPTLPYGDSVLVYAAASFANNVTPFGQAGGDVVRVLAALSRGIGRRPIVTRVARARHAPRDVAGVIDHTPYRRNGGKKAAELRSEGRSVGHHSVTPERLRGTTGDNHRHVSSGTARCLTHLLDRLPSGNT
ncbi:lysylphosphatidylglycerol synthase domain-containing protein [Halarchaeum nitratireducens]|uniref:Flippase-like domain-containing protein n=1 Tax=Halarchaeum nitratireducens TaxID=489913 RepID=A0A830GDZ8_9EURY|nr:lysylphosphatidylglycerol synthase domain-containing protein [Halarchaeum nitratireducens]GGN18896.1 hypothetical protein GCM10009021_19990 [Halarchaeum nitratireducens]